MKNYDGPSIYKKRPSNKGTEKERLNHSNHPSSSLLSSSVGGIGPEFKRSERKEKIDFSENYRLPEKFIPKSEEDEEEEREDLTKEKKQKHYQQTKKTQTFEEAVSENKRPFHATEVPSPMFGYTKEQKERLKHFAKKPTKTWNYSKLKERFKKEASAYLLVQGFETEELIDEWQKHQKEVSSLEAGRNKQLKKRRASNQIVKESAAKKPHASKIFSEQDENKK